MSTTDLLLGAIFCLIMGRYVADMCPDSSMKILLLVVCWAVAISVFMDAVTR